MLKEENGKLLLINTRGDIRRRSVEEH